MNNNKVKITHQPVKKIKKKNLIKLKKNKSKRNSDILRNL